MSEYLCSCNCTDFKFKPLHETSKKLKKKEKCVVTKQTTEQTEDLVLSYYELTMLNEINFTDTLSTHASLR